MRNNFAQQQNKRTKRSTVQTDFDPRQTLPSSAPLKKQSTTTNSGIYRNGLANTGGMGVRPEQTSIPDRRFHRQRHRSSKA